MKWIKYIGGFLILMVAVIISLSGIISLFENIVNPIFTEIIGGILTIVIGLYVGKIGLRLFKQERFKFW